jgi:hypothetical protein
MSDRPAAPRPRPPLTADAVLHALASDPDELVSRWAVALLRGEAAPEAAGPADPPRPQADVAKRRRR